MPSNLEEANRRIKDLRDVLGILTGTTAATLRSLQKPSLMNEVLSPRDLFLQTYDANVEKKMDSLSAHASHLLGSTRREIEKTVNDP